MKLSVVLLLAVVCAVVVASTWRRHEMREPSQAVVRPGWGLLRRAMEFHSDEWTDSPYTFPSPRIVVESRTCDTSACPTELARFSVSCAPVNADDYVIPYSGMTPDEFSQQVKRWVCVIGEVEDLVKTAQPIYMLQVLGTPPPTIICEDANGEPFVLLDQPYLPNSCFVKVALVDHTQPEPVKRENPMLRTTIQADRDRMEL
jgi:hypothetical protein